MVEMGAERRNNQSFPDNSEPSNVALPLRDGGVLLGESTNSTVVLYPRDEGGCTVVKIATRPGIRVYSTPEEAYASIAGAQKDLETISAIVPRAVEPEQCVICSTPDGKGITYLRLQSETVGSRLADTDINALSKRALEELSAIFRENIEMFKRDRSVFDIIGSTAEQPSVFTRFFRHLRPLSTSENIMVDDRGDIKIIDTAVLRYDSTNLIGKLRIRAQVIGSHLALRKMNRRLAEMNSPAEEENRELEGSLTTT